MKHTVFLTEQAEAELAKQFGEQTPQDVLYELLGVAQLAKQNASLLSYLDIPVLVVKGESDAWLALAPGHPFTVAREQSYEATWLSCCSKIDSLLETRSYSKLERRLQQAVQRGANAMCSLEKQAGVVALATALISMFEQYGQTTKAMQDASYMLACEVAVNCPEAKASAKVWAECNMLKYSFRTEAIEDFIAEQCK